VVFIIRGILGLCLAFILLIWSGEARAGQLADRLAQFPNWENKPPVTTPQEDLIYPDWMQGTWNVTSTLVEQVAPLAPEVVTPGFESNRRYLNQPVNFLVRFQAVTPQASVIATRFPRFTVQSSGKSQLSRFKETPKVVADRAFNGLNIAKAYLGDARVQSVKVDPNSPNRQITFLQTGLQLISIVTGRSSETPAFDQFISTEVSNQFFRGTPQPYFNQVETTTAYQLTNFSPDMENLSPNLSPTRREALNSPPSLVGNRSDRRSSYEDFSEDEEAGGLGLEWVFPHSVKSQYQLKPSPSLVIEADQITAIYLSPQDANYFKALEQPVALYRYRLELKPVEPTTGLPNNLPTSNSSAQSPAP
jgi:hypothetical protein